MIIFFVFNYVLVGFVVGLLSKESKFDKRYLCWLWFIAWPILGIVVNRKTDDYLDLEADCTGCCTGKGMDLRENINTCTNCRRSYTIGSEEWNEYPDAYIAEEEK